MHSIDQQLVFSATDLSHFLACSHLTLLDRRTALGGPQPPKYDDPSLEVLWQRGLEHEQAFLAALRSDASLRVIQILAPSQELPRLEYWAKYAGATRDAMRSGAHVIYQGALFDGTWLGRPDFLTRVERRSQLGDWSYEVVDTKLAREAKGGALLQILLYAELLATVQGGAPEHVHLALGGPAASTHTFRVADYAAYFRSIKGRFLQHVHSAPAVLPRAAEPVPHCDLCAWQGACDGERREVDHLSLVAGISKSQRRALVERGVATMAGLASVALPLVPRLDDVSAAALTRIHGQARLQVQGRREQRPVHELLMPIVEQRGLAALPEPSPGDLFFDLEGDPYALMHGIEYLFGFVDCEDRYTGWWALDRAAEKRAFEQFIDLVMARWQKHPDLHIYHFAHYEPTAIKKLMGRYNTREDEVDRLLRGKVFVDLLRVVKQTLRASVESYSIKKLERFYGYQRAVDLRAASGALAHFGAWLEGVGTGAGADMELLRQQIEGYNRDDCVSALRLRNWLETLRDDVLRRGQELPRPGPESAEPSEPVKAKQIEIDALHARLVADVPVDAAMRSAEQQARWLMAQLLEFHRREDKSMWWEYFRCLELSAEELIEDRTTLGGLEYQGVVGTVKRSELHRYRFPRQEHDLRPGNETVDPVTQKSAGDVWEVDDAAGTIDLKRGVGSEVPHPRALIPYNDVREDALRDSILRVGYAVAEHGLADANPYRCAVDLLLRHSTRGRSVLAVQGPPGSGKTFQAAQMIVEQLAAGKRVGVTATSHKVIVNLLDAIVDAAAQKGVAITGIQKAKEEQKCAVDTIVLAKDNASVRAALDSGEAQLAAGTAWLWSDDDLIDAVDVLFIDEAGQFSLANAIAVAPACKSMVLLGDPRQLEQPQQGVHPPGADVSALGHLLGDAPTLPRERGLFLDKTWRLHPEICAFTSEIFYQGRLTARLELAGQEVRGPAPWNGSGLRFVPVAHIGNTNESPEEAEVIATLVNWLVQECTWIDKHGAEQPLTLDHIVIVAPYNAQVATIAKLLPAGARVGTVDKFQGQEAPVSIYSMATSSADDAPRGMEFLYSPNRLNVATSRARCLAIVVASPALFAPDCKTPAQMRLANAFCRFRELTGLTAPA